MNEEPLSLQDFQAGKEQRQRMKDLEHARLKLEAEARDNGEQLREMAEKVFQLLERLMLAELGKKKSMEAFEKGAGIIRAKKATNQGTEDNASQRRIREKFRVREASIVVEDQLRGLQKMNSQLGQRLKEEPKSRIREEEACKEANEKVRTWMGVLHFFSVNFSPMRKLGLRSRRR